MTMYQISEKTAREIIKKMASRYASILANSTFDATDMCEEGMQKELDMDFLLDNPDLADVYKAEFSTTMVRYEKPIPKKLQRILK